MTMADFTDPVAHALDQAADDLKARAANLRAEAREKNARADELETAAGIVWHRGYQAQRNADADAETVLQPPTSKERE